jgi:hypothetical protein
VRALPEGEIFLPGEAKPILMDDPGASGSGNLKRPVCRTTIDHDNFVGAGAGS